MITAADFAKGKKESTPVKSKFITAASFAKSNPPPLPTKLQTVAEFGKEIVKGVVKPVATMVARPIQLGAELLFGVSDKDVNQFTKDKFGDWIAPTPQNAGDVYKDVGRGVQTALTAGIGGSATSVIKAGKIVPSVVGKLAAEGAGFGLGSSMEQGNKILSKETVQNVALGAGLSVAVPLALKSVSKYLKGAEKVKEIPKETPKEIPSSIVSETTPTIEQAPVSPISPSPEVKTPTGTNTQVQSGIPSIKSEQIERVAQRIEQDMPDLNDYQKQTNRQQIEELTKMDLQHVTNVSLGRELPKGNIPRTAYNAYLDNVADDLASKGDFSLSDELSKSNAYSQSGQSLQATQIASKDSLTGILRDVRQQMTSKVPQSEVKLLKLQNELKAKLKETKIVKPTRERLKEVLETLKCK